MTRLYNDYNTYLKEKYGSKVYRIGLDAGFSCPNRDGTKGTSGCTYCNSDGSRSAYSKKGESPARQLEDRISYLRREKGADKFIAYFQAFSNTYATVPALKKIYDIALLYPEIVGISIGTRPDTVDEEKLALISSYKNKLEVWIEYGLQSSNDRTLESIRRAHTYADFTRAVSLARKFMIPVTAHVILGLPGETRDDMMRTARDLAYLRIDAVKIHLLHILKGSALEDLYRSGSIKLLERDEYAELVCDFLEYLPKSTIIQRLTGQGPRETHLGPMWALDKTGTINKVEEILKKRGTCQGYRSDISAVVK